MEMVVKVKVYIFSEYRKERMLYFSPGGGGGGGEDMFLARFEPGTLALGTLNFT